MNKIKMIVTDLDKTLVRSDKTISDYSQGILRRCQESGIIIAFATARSETSCRKFTELVRPDAVISNGGALVRYKDEIIYSNAMDKELTNRILMECLTHPNIGYITADTDRGYFTNKPIPENDPVWLDFLPVEYRNFSKGLDCNAYKITIETDDWAVPYKIAEISPDIDVIPFSGEGWYRLAYKTANKWIGTLELIKYHRFEAREIAAFGDDYGDVEMIKNCGTGVAVCDAIDEVKAAANFICDTCDNDGMARWIEENVLKG